MVDGGLLNNMERSLGGRLVVWVGSRRTFFRKVMCDAKDTGISDQCSNDQTNWLTRPATKVLARKNLDILTPPSDFLLVLMASVSGAPKFCCAVRTSRQRAV